MSSSPFQAPPGGPANPLPFGLPGPGLTPPAPQPGGGRGGLIIVISVLGVALFLALGALLMFFLSGLSDDFSGYDTAPSDSPAEYELTGTLPQAVVGQPYSAEQVQDVVERLLYDDSSAYYGIECRPIADVKAAATTTCQGDIDGATTDITLTLDDDAGHFTMVQTW